MSNKIIIGCGSNQKNPLKQLNRAIALISGKKFIKINKISPIYKTSPIGFSHQPFFLNCVVSAQVKLGPHLLLKKLLIFEKFLGRQRTFKNAPRVIDLDLLTFNDFNKIITQNPILTIPHPELLNRKFTINPILDIEKFFRLSSKGLVQNHTRVIKNQVIIKTKKKLRKSLVNQKTFCKL